VYVKLASIARPRGLRGELVLEIHSSIHDILGPDMTVRLEAPGAELATRVVRAQIVGGRMSVLLEGIDDRAGAERWRGATLSVPRLSLPSIGDDRFFDFELVGADVVDVQGAWLGRVTEVLSAAANDVYVAAGQSGEILIPATARAVLHIDRESRRVTVDPLALVYEREADEVHK
jgi:16S rRNA processing protein RimM